MIKTKELEVGTVYVLDEGDSLAFIVTNLTPLTSHNSQGVEIPFIRICYRWLRHEYLDQYGPDPMEIDEEPHYEFRYHPEPFVIQELLP